ncbi:DVU_1555 family C-GCAxxG-C-C protein [Acetobacterium woodii]|uniref:Putative redox-active protein n=1 Tax=Acetobacterium woodii (strain ATCC 29683 / DSM 1030 / JCM 2381 / KCTC 1655 / WB1) TaxID=931626 RepID=H6LFI1_ACEWD|nr:DV_1555 family C-GCAxxG-C-C protein [Acetobacterium woodii]AFA49468.1 putative redox-active protein [Acetobacterium woodii DSM 1030]
MDELKFELYRLVSDGFCCSQIMLKLALDIEETENEDLIRVMNGLCNGIGGNQKTCGVLTGGIGVIGLYAGKGKPREWTKNNFGTMIKTYMNWFEERFERTDCVDLIGVYQFTDENNQVYPVKCGDILLESFQKVVEILQENGYTFGNREE